MAFPDVWDVGNLVWVAITSDTTGSSGWIEIEPIVTSIKFSPGKKGVEQLVTVGGGRLLKRTPQEMWSLEFEGTWVGNSITTSDSNLGPDQFFDQSGTYDSTSTISSIPSRGQNTFMVMVLFTTDFTNTTAQGSTTSTSYSYRLGVQNAKLTERTMDYDNALKGSFKFEGTVFQKDGSTNNYKTESSPTGAGALAAITASSWFSTS